ncbi:uncharacterized protein [Dermacentor albipictus]|uniref:uncharacterized protein isoform X2 n=1 Tax=Dermacentor albipictus TaxID=60249 RepID=UPI0038FCE1C4
MTVKRTTVCLSAMAVSFDTTEKLDATFLALLSANLRTSHPRLEHLEAGDLFSGEVVPESRWRSALAAYGVSLGEGHRLLVRSENVDFVHAFIDTWETIGEADTHVFLSWCTVQLAALFTRRSLIVSFYGSHRGAQLMHGAFCLARTYLLAGDAAFAGYSADVLYAGSRRQAEALAAMVRQQFRSSLAQWLHRNGNVTIVADWNSTDVMFRIVAAAIRVADGGLMNHTQLHYPDTGDSLVANWRNAVAAGRTVVSPSRSSLLTALEALAFHAEVDNDFVLLPYAFSFPLYDADALLAINYAGLGGQVAQALGELFLKAYRNSSSQAMESISQFTKCLALNNVTTLHAEAQALQGRGRGGRPSSGGLRGAHASAAFLRGVLLRSVSRSCLLHAPVVGLPVTRRGTRTRLRRPLPALGSLCACLRVRPPGSRQRRRRVQAVALKHHACVLLQPVSSYVRRGASI